MDSREIFKKCFERKSPKEISSELGVSVSLLYKWSEPCTDNGGSGAINPLDRTAQLLHSTGEEEILHWICREGGGFFVKDIPAETQQRELASTVNVLVQQFANLLGEIAHSSADQKITQDEAGRLRASWDSLRTRSEFFVRSCERGNFSGNL